MKVWVKIINISKTILILGAILFLTSCSGIILETNFVEQESSLCGGILPENEVTARGTSVCLEVPFQRYAGVNWCLPASAAMTLEFFGLNISQQQLAQKIIKPDGLGDIYKMVRFARDLGFKASFTTLTMEQIEESIFNNIPLIAIQKYKENNPLAHARVIIGYDAEKKEIITNDPTIGKNYTVSYHQFKKLNLTANPEYCMAIVITPDLSLEKVNYVSEV